MDTINKKFQDEILKIRNQKLTARQGLSLDVPAPGQLHRTLQEENPDLFFLITAVHEDFCDVIPGSFDLGMAGGNDVFLPKNVLGNSVFLSLDLAATLRKEAVGTGFASLDDASFRRSVATLKEFRSKKTGDIPSYPFALPYISDTDPAIAYHQEISEVIRAAQKASAAQPAKSCMDKLKLMIREALQTIQPVFPAAEATLAAAPQNEIRMVHCGLAGYPVKIVVRHSCREQMLRLDFYNESGENSSNFDSWRLFINNGEQIGNISNGICVFQNTGTFDGKIVLCDPADKIHILDIRTTEK